MDFRRDTVADLAAGVRAGEISAREVVQHSLDCIAADNDRINAFVAVDGERALQAAADVDEQVSRGEDPGPLAGIPFGVKDLEDAAGFPTSLGSALFAGRGPVQEDSLLVARLRAAGA